MRQLQLLAHGEPSDVIELNTVAESELGQEDVLISMEAVPLNPSDFVLVRGMYGIQPAFPSPVGAEGVGRVTRTGSLGDIDVALVPSPVPGRPARTVRGESAARLYAKTVNGHT